MTARWRWLVLACCFAVPVVAQAQTDDLAPKPWRFSGFSTLALTHNNNASAGLIFSQDQVHPARQGWSGHLDSVIGGQVDYRISSATDLVVQGVVRAGMGEPQLRMAFARHRLGGGVSFRVGRFRNPMFFDSDVAEVGYANLMVRPALPVYIVANSVPAVDGADLQWQTQWGDASVVVQGYVGKARYRQQFYDQNGEIGLNKVDPLRGAAASLNWPSLTLRASRTLTRSTIDSDSIRRFYGGVQQLAGGLGQAGAGLALMPGMAAAGAALQAQGAQIAGLDGLYNSQPSYTSVGFDGTANRWRFAGEWIELDTGSAMLGRFKGFQLTAGYSWGAWTPFVSTAALLRKTPLFDSSRLNVNTAGAAPALDGAATALRNGLDQSSQTTDISSRSISVGARWDFRDNMALKFQFDRIRTPGARANGPFAVPNPGAYVNGAHVFTISLDTVF